MLSKILDHTVRAIQNLPQLLRDSTTIQALVKSYCDQVQDLEEGLYTLINYWDLDTAEGSHLDRLGSFFEEYREGDSDVEYRKRVKAKRRALSRGTTIEDLISVCTLLGLDEVTVTEANATYYVTTGSYLFASNAKAEQYCRIIRACKPAGVRLNFEYFLSSSGLLILNTGTDGLGVGKLGGVLQ